MRPLRRSLVGLALMRIGVGVLACVRPSDAARLFGLAPMGGYAPYLWRLFGIRDVVLGVATAISRDRVQRACAFSGLVCDVSDSVAAALSSRDGQLTPPASAILQVVPAAAAGWGAWALARS